MKATRLIFALWLISIGTAAPLFVSADEIVSAKEKADRLLDQALDELKISEFAQSISDARAALNVYRTLPGSESAQARCLFAVGNGEWSSGNMEGARVAFEQVISVWRPKHGAENAFEAFAEYWLGAVLLNQDKWDAAVEPLKHSLDVRRKIDVANAPASAATLGRAYYLLERVDEAIPLLTEGSTAFANRVKTPNSADVEELAAATLELSDIMFARDQNSKGNELARLAWTYYSTQGRPTSLGLHNAVLVAMAAVDQGKLDEAKAVLDRASGYQSQMAPSDQVRAPYTLYVIATKQAQAYLQDLGRQCTTPSTASVKIVCKDIGLGDH